MKTNNHLGANESVHDNKIRLAFETMTVARRHSSARRVMMVKDGKTHTMFGNGKNLPPSVPLPPARAHIKLLTYNIFILYFLCGKK